MQELQLTRNDADHRLFELPGVGTLYIDKKIKLHVTATAAAGTWQLRRKNVYSAVTRALDPAGSEVAAYAPGEGVIHYGERAITVTRERKQPCIFSENGAELVSFEPKAWMDRPINVTLTDEQAAQREPLLILYCAFTSHWLAALASSHGTM